MTGRGEVPGYSCAPGPEVTSPFLLGDSRTHILRKKVMALRDGGGPGPPPLLPCSSSSPPGTPSTPDAATPPRTCGLSQNTGPPRTSPAVRPPLSRPERLSCVEYLAEEALLPFPSDPPPLGAMQPPILPGAACRLAPLKQPPEGRVHGGRALSALRCLSLSSSVTVSLDGPGR